jgi:hypothetical protein
MEKILSKDSERVSYVLQQASCNPEVAYALQNFERSLQRLLSVVRRPNMKKRHVSVIMETLGVKLKDEDHLKEKK